MASRLPEQRRADPTHPTVRYPKRDAANHGGPVRPVTRAGIHPPGPANPLLKQGLPVPAHGDDWLQHVVFHGPARTRATREIADAAATDPRRVRAQTTAADQAAARDTRSGSRRREARPGARWTSCRAAAPCERLRRSQTCPSRASRSRSVQSASTTQSLSSSAGGAISWFRCVPRAKLNHTSSGCRYASCIGFSRLGAPDDRRVTGGWGAGWRPPPA